MVVDINNYNKDFCVSCETIWLAIAVSDPDLINNNNNKQGGQQQG